MTKVITAKEVENYKKPVTESRILHISEMIHEVVKLRESSPEFISGYSTDQWLAFDALYRLLPGSVTVGTGDTGVGKTTFFVAWILALAKTGVPVGLVSLEEQWQDMAAKLARMIVGKAISDFEDHDVSFAGEIMEKLPFWFVDVKGPQSERFIHKAVRLMASEKGVRVCLIDHLDYILKASQQWQSESYVIGDCMRRLSGLAQDTSAAILLIAHPKKTEMKGYQDREIGMDELKGSSSIKQEASAVCGLWRCGDESTDVAIRFQKIRSEAFSQNRGAFVRFSFNQATGKYTELSLNPEWGKA